MKWGCSQVDIPKEEECWFSVSRKVELETENQLRLADVFVSITDPRQAAKVEHDLVELLGLT
jgi:hypothetical protein